MHDCMYLGYSGKLHGFPKSSFCLVFGHKNGACCSSGNRLRAKKQIIRTVNLHKQARGFYDNPSIFPQFHALALGQVMLKRKNNKRQGSPVFVEPGAARLVAASLATPTSSLCLSATEKNMESVQPSICSDKRKGRTPKQKKQQKNAHLFCCCCWSCCCLLWVYFNNCACSSAALVRKDGVS